MQSTRTRQAPWFSYDGRGKRRRRQLLGALAAIAAALTVGVGSGNARPAKHGDTVTIDMIASFVSHPGLDVLIPNFERVYPDIKISVTYTASITDLYQLETTELAAGNAPDVLQAFPGCGTPISMCALARAGDLAPMLKKPWVKRSVPLITSLDKYGQGLFGFEPYVSIEGVFTNDSLFGKLGLKVPQTFSQLLDLCQKAKSDGTVALIVGGGDMTVVSALITDLAVATVYGKDSHWSGDLRAGKVTFDGTPGWHQAVQELIDMSNAGCFQPGATGTTAASSLAQFAQGQGLMVVNVSSQKGTIDAGAPQFTFSHHQFPGGTTPHQTRSYINLAAALAVNAHSSAQDQSAAQTFVDFIARPKQDALYAQILGGLTQYNFLKGQVPAFMSDDASLLTSHGYVINPDQTWWNASVQLALAQNGIGVLTGQRSVDDVLNAMDAAWKQGPS